MIEEYKQTNVRFFSCMIWRDEREIVQVLLKEKSSHVYCLNTNFSICASMDKDLY